MNSMIRSLDLVVFDMAGTTVLDDGQVPAAFTAALAEHGLTVGPDAIRALRGASKRQAILGLLPPGRVEQADRVYASFRDHLTRAYTTGVRAVPGAAELFAALRRLGVRVALNTGFDRDTVELLLAALRWDDGRVDAVVCGDDVPQGRPAPYLIFRCMEAVAAVSVRRVVVVGDTALDLRAGYNAGVRYNVGVLSGAHDRGLLVNEPHTHLIASVADLPGVLADAEHGASDLTLNVQGSSS
jgi:phosphonatase-like hydrolase